MEKTIMSVTNVITKHREKIASTHIQNQFMTKVSFNVNSVITKPQENIIYNRM